MPKPQQVLMFVAADIETAVAAGEAFHSGGGLLSASWALTASANPVRPDALKQVAAVVCVDLPQPTLSGWTGRVEHVSMATLTQEAPKLVARLLGGRDEDQPPPKPVSPPPLAPKKVHTVKLSRETAGRKGKGVTVISELPLNDDELKELATQLKNKCGTGGTAKDGRIEIQGDHRDRIAQELERLGYKVKRSGG